jgi:hypothetical protein
MQVLDMVLDEKLLGNFLHEVSKWIASKLKTSVWIYWLS